MRLFLLTLWLACSFCWSSAAQVVVVSSGESTGGGFLSIDNTPVFTTIGATRLLTGTTTDTGGGGPFTGPVAAIRGQALGTRVTAQGVVGRARGTLAYLQDNTGGLMIRQTSGAFFDAIANGTVAPGTQIAVTGTLSAFRGLLQINEADIEDFTVLGQGAAPVPLDVTLQEISTNGERYEGVVVRVQGLTIETNDAAFAENTNYDVRDATLGVGAVQLRIHRSLDSALPGVAVPPSPVVFTGVGGQFTTGALDVGYQLVGTNTNDIAGAPSPTNAPPSAPQITAPGNNAVLSIGGPNPNGAIDPATPFVVTWTTSTDPDGDPVAYSWQLATENTFAQVLLSSNTGTTRYETTYGALSAVLDTSIFRLNQGLTLFHRVIASDGQATTTSTTAQLTLIRGTLTDTDDEAEVPEAFTVHGNYPNPFNPTTTIVFDLAESAEVRVEISDLMGRVVRVVEGGTLSAGAGQTMDVEASDMASGTYLYRVIAQTTASLHVGYGRMVLLK